MGKRESIFRTIRLQIPFVRSHERQETGNGLRKLEVLETKVHLASKYAADGHNK